MHFYVPCETPSGPLQVVLPSVLFSILSFRECERGAFRNRRSLPCKSSGFAYRLVQCVCKCSLEFVSFQRMFVFSFKCSNLSSVPVLSLILSFRLLFTSSSQRVCKGEMPRLTGERCDYFRVKCLTLWAHLSHRASTPWHTRWWRKKLFNVDYGFSVCKNMQMRTCKIFVVNGRGQTQGSLQSCNIVAEMGGAIIIVYCK